MKTYPRPFEELPEIARLAYWDMEAVADVNGNLAASRQQLRRLIRRLRRRNQIDRAIYFLAATDWIRFYEASRFRVCLHLPHYIPDAGRFPFKSVPHYAGQTGFLPTDSRTVSRHYRNGKRLKGKARKIPSDRVPPPRRGPEDVMCFTKPPSGVLHLVRVDLAAGHAELLRPSKVLRTGPHVCGSWLFARHGSTAVVYHVQAAGFVKIGQGTGTNAAALAAALEPLLNGTPCPTGGR